MIKTVIAPDGTVVAVGEPTPLSGGLVVAGVFFQFPPFLLVDAVPPRNDPGAYRWNGQSFDLVVVPVDKEALVRAKLSKNLEINAARERATYTTFKHLGKDVACDVLSRSDIDAVAAHIGLTGQLPVGFPGGWKYVDNTICPIPNADAFKSLHRSMVAQGTANFNKSQMLKAELAKAETLEDIETIKW
jgi:hypothetical protein